MLPGSPGSGEPVLRQVLLSRPALFLVPARQPQEPSALMWERHLSLSERRSCFLREEGGNPGW